MFVSKTDPLHKFLHHSFFSIMNLDYNKGTIVILKKTNLLNRH